MTIRHVKLNNKGRGHWKLRDVAQAIAKKAFEHLTAPLEAEEHALTDALYKSIIKDAKLTAASISKLVQCGLVQRAQNCTIEVSDTSGNLTRISTHAPDDTEEYLSGAGYVLEVESNEYYDRAQDILTRKNRLGEKMDELVDELTKQLDGRSTKEVMTKWPEAWPVVAEELGIKLDQPDLFVPLERLLAKFLPALPAPKR